MTEPLQWLPDGSAFNPRFGDRYHSSHNHGLSQARGVFLQGNGLPAAWAHRQQWRIVETGFGCGLNFLVTWAAWRADPQRCHMLHFTSTEAYPVASADIVRAAPPEPALQSLAAELAAQFQGLTLGVHRLSFEGGRVLLTLLVGDAQTMLRAHTTRADSLYLDGFGPRVNPHMWSTHLFAAVARHCQRGTTLATWCVAADVRKALMENGFIVEKTPGIPPKRSNLRGHYAPAWLVAHLGEKSGLPPEPAPSQQPTSPQNGLIPARPQKAQEACGSTLAALGVAQRAASWSAPTTTTQTSSPSDVVDAIVIGAGLAGAAAAHSLAQRGWSVHVLEAGEAAASGASGLPAGVFAPLVSADDNPSSRLSRAGIRLTLQRLRQLHSAGLVQGRDWAHTGVIERLDAGSSLLKKNHLFQHPQAAHWSNWASHEQLASSGITPPETPSNNTSADPVAPTPASALAPHAALFHAQAGWVRPAELVRAQLNHPRIQLHTNARVAALSRIAAPNCAASATTAAASPNHCSPSAWLWQALDDEGRPLGSAARIAIIATGAAAPALLPAPAPGQIHSRPTRKNRSTASNTATAPSSPLAPSEKTPSIASTCTISPPPSVAPQSPSNAHTPDRSLVVFEAGWVACDAAVDGVTSTAPAPTWPLRPIRGQVVCGRSSSHDFNSGAAHIRPIPLNGNGNFVPHVPHRAGDDGDDGAGFWVMGSTFERGAIQLPPSAPDQAAARAYIGAKAQKLLPPTLYEHISQHFDAAHPSSVLPTWAAVRCTSSDRLPLVGRVGTQDGLWALTALGARGLTLSVLCAELLAAWLCDEPPPIEDALAAKLDARRPLPELPSA